MSEFTELSEFTEDPEGRLKQPFEYPMEEDGETVYFRIGKVKVRYPETIERQLEERDEVEIKYVLRDDDDAIEEDNVENWKMVLFPMYRKGREILHGDVASYDVSAINGNIVVKNREVTYVSSNHC